MRPVLVFRQFGNKGYSLFACLGREVVCSVLSVTTLTYASAESVSPHPVVTDSAAMTTAREADKGQGLLTMAAYVGLDPAFTIAFGDGGNDTTMIRTAGIGIAMGNAIEALKQEANYVTTSVDNDGILNALKHFGLI